jgi:hypothetical protein
MDGAEGAVIGRAFALLFSVAVMIVANAAAAKEASMHDRGLIEFARDFSGNDPVVMKKVERFVETAPTKIEDIGFYGSGDDAPEYRKWLATVSALEDAGHLIPSEDKYSNEFVHVLAQNGKIDINVMPAKVKQFWNDVLGGDSDLGQRAFRKIAWEIYAEATRAVEAQLAARGKALLSIDATDGDTMYFAIVDKAVADKWRGTGFGNFTAYDGGIREPMWDRYWFFLAYSVGSKLVDGNKMALPPGIREREAGGKLKPYAAP